MKNTTFYKHLVYQIITYKVIPFADLDFEEKSNKDANLCMTNVWEWWGESEQMSPNSDYVL